MRWAIKHKSGRTLFETSDEFIADNRRKMGWIVEEVKMTSRERFEIWCNERAIKSNYQYMAGLFYRLSNGDYSVTWVDMAWEGWQASRAAIEIKACPCPNDHGPNVDDHYREQINNAGLKVKK